MDESAFEWSEWKNRLNKAKHGVSFEDAQYAFIDAKRILLVDSNHSHSEERFYCIGLNREKTGILTVRFTWRQGRIRIIGAGYWRRGRRHYEQENQIFKGTD